MASGENSLQILARLTKEAEAISWWSQRDCFVADAPPKTKRGIVIKELGNWPEAMGNRPSVKGKKEK